MNNRIRFLRHGWLALVALTLISLTLIESSNHPPELSGELDSVSYYTGIFASWTLQELEIEEGLNEEVFYRAITEVLEAQDPVLSKSDADFNIGWYFEKIRNRLNDQHLRRGREILQKNTQAEGMIQTESGLQFRINREGSGSKPVVGDRLLVKYEGFTLDNSQFEQSVNPDTITLSRDEMISGLFEGVQLMNIGAHYTFLIPTELAFGVSPPAYSKVKPNMPVVYEFELIEIIDK